MNKTVIAALSNMGEVDFKELKHALSIADFAGNMMKEFQLSEAEMEEKLSINKEEYYYSS